MHGTRAARADGRQGRPGAVAAAGATRRGPAFGGDGGVDGGDEQRGCFPTRAD